MLAMTPENLALFEPEGRGPADLQRAARAAPSCAPRDGLDAPDIQFHSAPMLLHEEFLGAARRRRATRFGPCLLKPTSRG